MLPQLRRLEEQFAGGLVVLGIHSPKFPNERETAALREAVRRLEVSHPVANDREFSIWQAYGVRAWPTLVLIDPRSCIIAHHEGEWEYPEMAATVQAVLEHFRAEGLVEPGPAVPAQGPAESVGGLLRFPGKAIAVPGGLAVSDTGHHRVLLLDREGQVRAVAGGGQAGLTDGGLGQARFQAPQGLVWYGETLLVADTGNHALRAIDWRRGVVRTLAGDGRQGGLWASPWDLATDGQQVYVAMAGTHRLVLWSPERPGGTVLAGSGWEGLRDGPARVAEFAQPSGLCLDGGVLYVADSESSAVRAVDPVSGATRTLVGEGLFTFGDADGRGAEVRLQHCMGVAAWQGLLYVADTFNHRLKRLDPATGEAKAFAGQGRAGLADGPGAEALFWEPGGVSLAEGQLLVADTNNHALRLVDPATAEVRTLAVRGL